MPKSDAEISRECDIKDLEAGRISFGNAKCVELLESIDGLENDNARLRVEIAGNFRIRRAFQQETAQARALLKSALSFLGEPE